MIDHGKFYAQVRLIAIHLGNYWTYDERKEKDNTHVVYVSSKNGGSLCFYHNTHKKRITVSGVFPLNVDGRSTDARYWGLVPNDSDFGSITISVDRNPSVAANDIRRRLVNDYIRLYALAKEKKAKSQGEVEKAHIIMDAVKRVCKTRNYNYKTDPRYPELAIDNYKTSGPRGTIKYSCYDGKMDLTIEDLDPDVAIQMLALMQNHHNKTG